jgi:1-aminocyclopropane-1-carboxylate deaminase
MFDATNIQIQSLKSHWWKNIPCDVLRLDQLHPVVSGNKWFKLKYYTIDAKQLGYDTVATFGGAYSNHIVATAFACKEAGLKSIGIIRGEKTPQLSATLTEALGYGMELVFVSREFYRDKQKVREQYPDKNWYWVNEGGYGIPGMTGAKDILNIAGTDGYSHIICACGTGTTLAGLVAAALPGQFCIGISALKGYVNLRNDVMDLLPGEHQSRDFEVFNEYHFGGYAKHPAALLQWMNELWEEERLPTDIVYTSRLMYAVKDLISKQYFSTRDKLLVIHSGGLQGNRSLPEATLAFL